MINQTDKQFRDSISQDVADLESAKYNAPGNKSLTIRRLSAVIKGWCALKNMCFECGVCSEAKKVDDEK